MNINKEEYEKYILPIRPGQWIEPEKYALAVYLYSDKHFPQALAASEAGISYTSLQVELYKRGIKKRSKLEAKKLAREAAYKELDEKNFMEFKPGNTWDTCCVVFKYSKTFLIKYYKDRGGI